LFSAKAKKKKNPTLFSPCENERRFIKDFVFDPEKLQIIFMFNIASFAVGIIWIMLHKRWYKPPISITDIIEDLRSFFTMLFPSGYGLE
jgi:hypothetical protein